MSNERKAIVMVDQAIRDLKELKTDLELAYEVQWERPKGPSDPDDPGIRSRGGHSDPTGDAAASGERLALRKAVKLTEHDSERLAKATLMLASRLRRRLRPYDGE